MDVLDARTDETHFPGAQFFRRRALGREDADLVDFQGLALGLDDDPLAGANAAVHHAHERDHAEIVVEPGIDDQRLQVRLGRPFRRRYEIDDLFENPGHSLAGLGAGADGVGGVDADDFLDFLAHTLGLGMNQIHLVQHRNDFHVLLESRVTGGDRLRFDALGGVDHEQRAFAGRQRA